MTGRKKTFEIAGPSRMHGTPRRKAGALPATVAAAISRAMRDGSTGGARTEKGDARMADEDLLRGRGRALTDAEKRAVLDRIYIVWTLPGLRLMRLGQLLVNVARALRPVDLFYVEDDELARRAETFAAPRRES